MRKKEEITDFVMTRLKVQFSLDFFFKEFCSHCNVSHCFLWKQVWTQTLQKGGPGKVKKVNFQSYFRQFYQFSRNVQKYMIFMIIDVLAL